VVASGSHKDEAAACCSHLRDEGDRRIFKCKFEGEQVSAKAGVVLNEKHEFDGRVFLTEGCADWELVGLTDNWRDLQRLGQRDPV
jgi:hypothetical protein